MATHYATYDDATEYGAHNFVKWHLGAAVESTSQIETRRNPRKWSSEFGCQIVKWFCFCRKNMTSHFCPKLVWRPKCQLFDENMDKMTNFRAKAPKPFRKHALRFTENPCHDSSILIKCESQNYPSHHFSGRTWRYARCNHFSAPCEVCFVAF